MRFRETLVVMLFVKRRQVVYPERDSRSPYICETGEETDSNMTLPLEMYTVMLRSQHFFALLAPFDSFAP